MKNQTLSHHNIYQISQQKSDYNQAKSNRRIHINVQNVFIFTHKYLLIINANIKQSIARAISIVNTFHFSRPVLSEKLGTINTAPSQPADKLINKSAKIKFQTANAFINRHHTTL